MVKYKIFSFLFILSCSVNWAQAANQCFHLFINNKTNTIIELNQKTEVQSLETLGKAMTEGMLLHPEQGDIFEIYRKVFLGDPNTSLNGNKLETVIAILKKYPNLTKKLFPEYEIKALEKIYETPDALDKFIKSQITTAGQTRSNLFQLEANLSYWKKVLDYKDPIMPESLKPLNLGKDSTPQDKERARAINKARIGFQEMSQQRFIKYLNRIISKTNRDLLANLKNDDITYAQKAKTLFETLKYVEGWMSQKGRDTLAIRQAMLDLVFTIGYGNQSTLNLLKSKNALDKIQGLNQLWNEADAFAETLNYQGHFAELKAKLNIEYPTGLSKNEEFIKMIQTFEKTVRNSPYSTKPTEVIRVRSLSIQESPFRSCLGKDCSSRTYFDKAFDPNYIYFTMTDVNYKSDGQVTIVLGTAKNKQTGLEEKVAFLDKLQNIPTTKLENFLNAINRSLQEDGYRLAIPSNLGKDSPGHGGLSNMDVITDFVQLNIMPRLNKVRGEFTPHSHEYNFLNQYSRADQKLEVRLFEEKALESDTEIQRGKHYQPFAAEKSIDKKTLLQDFLKLRDSDKEEDQMKFIKSGNFIKSLESFGLYSKVDFIADLQSILSNKDNSFNIRKNSFYELVFFDSTYVYKHDENFTPAEFKHLASEINQWKNSSDSRKKTTIENIYANSLKQFIEFCTANDLKNLQSILRSPFFSISAKDYHGNTALMLAARYGSKDTVELLLKQPSIDVSAKDEYGRTALILVVAWNGSKDTVELLLKHPSIDVNAKDNDENTALKWAAWNGSKDAVELLLKHPSIDVNAKDNDENTALIQAAEKGHKDAVELLLKHPSIDVNAKDKYENTALMQAAKKGHKDAVEFLLKHPSIDVNAKDKYGRTALMSAARYGSKDTVEILLKHLNIDVNAKDTYEKTALMLAAERDSKYTTELLLKHPSIDVNAKDNYYGRTALMLAAEHGSKYTVEHTLKHPSIDVNAKDNYYEKTALMLAAERGSKDEVEHILKYPGIDINAKDKYGNTALMLAAQKGIQEIVELLLKHTSIDVNAKNNNGKTALMLATSNGFKEKMELLLKYSKKD